MSFKPTSTTSKHQQLSLSMERRARISFTNSTSNAANENTRPSGSRRRKNSRPKSLETRNKQFVKEVRRLINSKKPMIPRLSFARLVREIMMVTNREVDRITISAMEALQESCEMYLTNHLADAYMLSLHCGRVTLMHNDLKLLHYLNSPHGS